MKYFLLLFFLIIAEISYSQDTAMDTVSTNICNCLNDQDIDRLTADELGQVFQVCLVQGAFQYMEKYIANLNLDEMTETDMNVIMEQKGIEITIQAAEKCPEVMTLMIQAGVNFDPDNTSITMTLVGRVDDIFDGEFISISFIEKKGRKHKLYWMEYFEGSETIMTDRQSCLGREIKVVYKELEAFNPQLKDYIRIKVITALTWL